MGIARDDKAGRYDAWLRNYALFDAPHVAIVACDRAARPVRVRRRRRLARLRADRGGGARHRHLPDGVGRRVSRAAAAALPIADTESILFGLVLGHADEAAPANACRTTREPIAANVTFVGASRERSTDRDTLLTFGERL